MLSAVVGRPVLERPILLSGQGRHCWRWRWRWRKAMPESQSAWIGMLVGYPATCAFVGLVTHRINLHYNPKVLRTR